MCTSCWYGMINSSKIDKFLIKEMNEIFYIGRTNSSNETIKHHHLMVEWSNIWRLIYLVFEFKKKQNTEVFIILLRIGTM